MAAGGHFGFWPLLGLAHTFARGIGAQFFLNTSKYPNPLSNLPLLSVVTGGPNMTLLIISLYDVRVRYCKMIQVKFKKLKRYKELDICIVQSKFTETNVLYRWHTTYNILNNFINGIQIMNVYECNGTNVFMRWKMKCSIQRGKAELNCTFYLPTNENIFVPLHEWENIHYLFYITCTKIQILKQI